MAGIYIHIPYCKKACHYCNFHFSTTRYHAGEMMDCIVREAGLRKGYLQDNIETIYFGGGTPSLIDREKIGEIINAVYRDFFIAENPEITLEANPDDIDKEKLLQWKALGINRLSIGIQSFQEEDLRWMNRAHDARQARDCIVLAQDHGFENISCDLIYGTPALSDEMWQENLAVIASSGIPHLSAYALTVEPKTALHKMIEKHKTADVDPGKQVQQFDLLMRWAQENDFEHYEISNFAKRGFRSRHNSSYWQGKHYLGLGPSAHSFNGNARQWNVSNNTLYLHSLQNGCLDFEEELLTGENKLNEYIMISLRTIEGMDLHQIEKDFGPAQKDRVARAAQKYIHKEMLVSRGNYLVLADRGKHYADGIAAELFI